RRNYEILVECRHAEREHPGAGAASACSRLATSHYGLPLRRRRAEAERGSMVALRRTGRCAAHFQVYLRGAGSRLFEPERGYPLARSAKLASSAGRPPASCGFIAQSRPSRSSNKEALREK